jgi:hypothetical protein
MNNWTKALSNMLYNQLRRCPQCGARWRRLRPTGICGTCTFEEIIAKREREYDQVATNLGVTRNVTRPDENA